MDKKNMLPIGAMNVEHYPMTDRRRNLYLRIVDDALDIHGITQRLFFLDDHFPPHQIEVALLWLINNRHTGKQFMNWFRDECRNSDLEMHRMLLSVVVNLPLDRVLAGKNFKL